LTGELFSVIQPLLIALICDVVYNDLLIMIW